MSKNIKQWEELWLNQLKSMQNISLNHQSSLFILVYHNFAFGGIRKFSNFLNSTRKET